MTDTEVAVALSKIETMGKDLGEIKATLKEVAVAMNRMSLIEERQSVQSQALERAFKTLGKVEERVNDLELAQPIQKQSSDMVQKVAALILAAVVGSGVTAIVHQRPNHPVALPTATTGK